jgi:tRNA modification GTPase
MLIAAEALRQARLELDAVTGRAGVEDMLDMLFGRFCIGK